MKAIRKSDGKIIDVEIHGLNSKNCPISYRTNFKDFYKPEDLDFNVPKECLFDWQSFRAEAAKDILCAVLPSIQIIDRDFQKSLNNAISNSIDTADELVKQLKEKEEK